MQVEPSIVHGGRYFSIGNFQKITAFSEFTTWS